MATLQGATMDTLASLFTSSTSMEAARPPVTVVHAGVTRATAPQRGAEAAVASDAVERVVAGEPALEARVADRAGVAPAARGVGAAWVVAAARTVRSSAAARRRGWVTTRVGAM